MLDDLDLSNIADEHARQAIQLLLNLVETRHLTPEKLAQIKKLVSRTREEQHGND